MPRVKLPIDIADEKQTDALSTSAYNKAQLDGYFSQAVSSEGQPVNIWNRRHGLTSWVDFEEDAAIDGAFWWVRQQKLVVVCNGKVFYVNEDGTYNEKTGTATMEVGVVPTFAEVDGTKLYIASSGKIGEYTSGAGNDGVYISDVDAPTTVTHIATLDKMLIGLSANSERFDRADVNTPTSWQSNFYNAEAHPDKARALFVEDGQIKIIGEATTELWRNNGGTFVRDYSGVLQVGTVAPYSYQRILGKSYWLSENGEVVEVSGRQINVISLPYAKYIQSFSELSDAVGGHLVRDGNHFYVLYFPTASKTIVYDVVLGRWYQWTSGGSNPYVGKVFQHVPLWGFMVVGSRSDSVLYKLSSDAQDDAGTDIQTILRTDFIGHGSYDVPKFSKRLLFHLKRTKVASGPTTLSFRYRNDGSTTWKDARTITVEATDQTDMVVPIRVLGRYFQRQYEFKLATDSSVALVGVEEDFDYGG